MPEHIVEPPDVESAYSVYWTAYADLQHERPQSLAGGLRRIPWSAIATYAKHHGLNVDELKRCIWALDSEFIDAKPAPVENDDNKEHANG